MDAPSSPDTEGGRVVIEHFAVRLPESRYRVENVEKLSERSYEDYRRTGVDYVVATSAVLGEVLPNPRNSTNLHAPHMTLVTCAREAARFAPTTEHPGPEIVIFQVR